MCDEHEDEKDNEILAELYQIRAEFAQRFNCDIHAMVEYLTEMEKAHPERVIYDLPPREPRPGEPRAA